jgi:hypothetical protein
VIDCYTRQSRFTDPGTMAAWLDGTSTDLAGIRDTAARSVFHYRAYGDITGHGFTADREHEINLRYASDMLARLHELDPAPPSTDRAVTDRVVGCCRDHTLLFFTMARHHGIPARARVGFGTYLVPGWAVDHVVAEVWLDGRWRLVEPQFDPGFVDPSDGTPLDLLDVPRDKFLVGPDAWVACRSGAMDPERFVVAPDLAEPFLRGWSYLRHNLVFDLAALNRHEMILWDLWGVLTPGRPRPDDARMDALAALLRAPDLTVDRIAAAFDDEDVRVPDTVVSVTPPGFTPERITLRRQDERIMGG